MSESILYILSSVIVVHGVMLSLNFVAASWLEAEVWKSFEKHEFYILFLPASTYAFGICDLGSSKRINLIKY